MKILYSVLLLALITASCTGDEEQDNTGEAQVDETLDQPAPAQSDQEVALDPYAVYFQLNSEASQEVLGIVAVTRYQSDEQFLSDNDADGDGVLNDEEKGKATESIRDRKAEIKQVLLDSLVALADQNEDGEVSAEEIMALLDAKRTEFREALTAKNQEIVAANKALHDEVRLACPSDEEAPAAEDLTEEIIDAEILACDEAKEAAKKEQFDNLAAKRDLIKDMVAQNQAIIDLINLTIGEAAEDDRGKGKDKDKDKDKDQ